MNYMTKLEHKKYISLKNNINLEVPKKIFSIILNYSLYTGFGFTIPHHFTQLQYSCADKGKYFTRKTQY